MAAPFDSEQVAQAVLSACSSSAAAGERAHLTEVCRTALAQAAHAVQGSHARAAQLLQAASEDAELCAAFADSADASQQQQQQDSSAAAVSQVVQDSIDAARADAESLRRARAVAEAQRESLQGIRARLPAAEATERPVAPPARGKQRRLRPVRDDGVRGVGACVPLAAVWVRCSAPYTVQNLVLFASKRMIQPLWLCGCITPAHGPFDAVRRAGTVQPLLRTLVLTASMIFFKE